MMPAKKILARSLEVNLTAHCNLSCYGCDHASPVNAEEYLSVEELAKNLAALAPVYHVFEFRLTGGEPLLHPELLQIIDVIRASGVAEKIMLVTNGVLLHNAPKGLWERIDKIWVSLYPGVKRKLSEDDIKALAARHGVLVWCKPTDEFSMKLLHAENRDRALVKAIYSTCLLRSSCHTVHKGRYFKCSPSPFVPSWLQRVGLAPPDFSRDGIALQNNANLRQQLEAYLRDEEPLAACAYCLGCAGKTIASRQMNKAAVQHWLAEQDPDPRELIDWKSLEESQAHRELGMNLSGLLSTMAGQKVRWLMTLWLRGLLGIDLTGAPPTMVGLRIRGLFKRLLGNSADAY